MFGSRPDILVVRGKGNVGLIAIEIKQPIGETKLRNFGKVIGHAYDHAMGMKAFNVGTDIVLVTSFEESFLGSLTKADLMQDADNVVETSSDSTQGNPDGPGVQDDPIHGIYRICLIVELMFVELIQTQRMGHSKQTAYRGDYTFLKMISRPTS